MQVGDLVRYVGKMKPDYYNRMGIVVRVCEEVITTVDVLIGDKVLEDNRTSLYEVINESR